MSISDTSEKVGNASSKRTIIAEKVKVAFEGQNDALSKHKLEWKEKVIQDLKKDFKSCYWHLLDDLAEKIVDGDIFGVQEIFNIIKNEEEKNRAMNLNKNTSQDNTPRRGGAVRSEILLEVENNGQNSSIVITESDDSGECAAYDDLVSEIRNNIDPRVSSSEVKDIVNNILTGNMEESFNIIERNVMDNPVYMRSESENISSPSEPETITIISQPKIFPVHTSQSNFPDIDHRVFLSHSASLDLKKITFLFQKKLHYFSKTPYVKIIEAYGQPSYIDQFFDDVYNMLFSEETPNKLNKQVA